jgi:histidinol-phosphate aminotransferase
MTSIALPMDSYQTVGHTVEGLHLEANEHHENIYRRSLPEINDLHRYPDSQCKRLIESLASFLDISPGQLYLTNGSIEAIEEVLARTARGRIMTVGLIQPSYTLYEMLARRNELDVRTVGMNPDDSARQLYTWAHYADTLGSADLCIVGSPNNPTGTLLDGTTALSILAQYGGDLVVDEAYIEYACHHRSLGRLAIDNPRLLVIRTFSKAWGLAAIRLGYIVGHPDVISGMKRGGRPYRIPNPTQQIAINALENSDKMIQSVHRNNQLRSRMADSLRRFRSLVVSETQANFIVLTYHDAELLWRFLGRHRIFVKLLDPLGTALRIAVPDEAGLNCLVGAIETFFEHTSAGHR